MRRDRSVDTRSLTFEVQIEQTNDDAGVVRLHRVQPNEMPAVQRYNGPLTGTGQLKNGFVGERLPGLAGVDHGDDVVPDSTGRFDDWERKVLVSE